MTINHPTNSAQPWQNFDKKDLKARQQGYYIGMMSGTSLDGLDAALCQFWQDEAGLQLRLLATHHQAFDPVLQSALLALCRPNGVQDWLKTYPDFGKNMPLHETESISELDIFGWASVQYAEFASEVVKALLAKTDLDRDAIVAIGCHGQTVRHRPHWAFSLQLLDANVLAERTGICVVSDFRRRDMAVGGQGAPLVPAFHQALFAKQVAQNATTLVLNLGGIANITLLNAPFLLHKTDQQILGFDTGPANLLLDAWCQRHTGNAFDQDGAWAKTGKIIPALLNRLEQHDFFALPAPKSTGREDFHLAWVDQILGEFADQNQIFLPEDVQATLTELTAISVAKGIILGLEELAQLENSNPNYINDNLPSNHRHTNLRAQVFVCGGGALNGYLKTRLLHQLNTQFANPTIQTQFGQMHWTIHNTEVLGLAPLWVEAVAFAWLARQTLLNQPGNLPAVTGATKAVVLGNICF